MVWIIVERAVHIATLMLLILMIAIIFSNNKSSDERTTFNLQLEEFKQEVARVRSKNIEYLENRINRQAETQDNYQNSTSSKLTILEKRIIQLELQAKTTGPRIINNNQSSAVVNLPPLSIPE